MQAWHCIRGWLTLLLFLTVWIGFVFLASWSAGKGLYIYTSREHIQEIIRQEKE